MRRIGYDKVTFIPSTPWQRERYRDALCRAGSQDRVEDVLGKEQFAWRGSFCITPAQAPCKGIENLLSNMGFSGEEWYICNGVYIIDGSKPILVVDDLRRLAGDEHIDEVVLESSGYTTVVS